MIKKSIERNRVKVSKVFIQFYLDFVQHSTFPLIPLLSHPDLRGKPGCVLYVRQRRKTHIMTKCIEINVTNFIT
jgi:CRISPR/Cas system-associated endoribonuclease Cas2